ncbi:hypothetical protein LIER_13074 [Lithospermum erythrorhizon]|uniref:MLO-like protein n=1 Tax=Lithospermum erythrorhizon TaxID=34254 RepID=A0AAV3PU28_LITER
MVVISPQNEWAFVQLLCSYSTLPLYAIVTQMGTYFNKSMFDENVQVGLVDWARKAKKRRQGQKNDGGRATQANSSSGDTSPHNQLGVIIDHRT